ncbi:MAG: EamA family transporter [Patescibacteria group bacterium]|nr:EamA family transporter [Patescibacteria group bacterium]
MRWEILALLSAISAALVAIFGKIGLSKLDNVLATTIRSIIMALFLITVSLYLNKFKSFEDLDQRSLIYIILAGISGALSWLFYFAALQQGPASAVAALDRLSIVFVFIFSVLFLAEKFSWLQLMGVILISIGAILMILKF